MRKWNIPTRVLASPLLLRRFLSTMERERRNMQMQFMQVRGLMPLLMKPRNKEKWSTQDKQELMMHLRNLSALSPYVAVIVLPGGASPCCPCWHGGSTGAAGAAGAAARRPHSQNGFYAGSFRALG